MKISLSSLCRAAHGWIFARLDIRLVSRDNVSLLNRVRIKAVHFAWDNPDEDLTGYFQRFLDLTAIKSSRQRRVYVLTNYGSTHEQDLYRVNTLRAMGFDPYVMIYERPTAPPCYPPFATVG